MLSLGAVTFLAPWVLGGLATLPLVWWLLRLTPPAPKRVVFPAIRLLFGLEARQQTAARTPWWLVVLRLTLAALVLAAVAHPVLNAGTLVPGGPVLLVVDDGWASARTWPQRRDAIESLLQRAERAGRPVILLPTAPPADGQPVAVQPLRPAAEVRTTVQALEPKPWPVDREGALRALRTVEHAARTTPVWVADGVDDDYAAAFAESLATFGRLALYADPPRMLPHVLVPPPQQAGDLTPRVRRLTAEGEDFVTVRAADAAGRTLAHQGVTLPAGVLDVPIPLPLPAELRNRVARVDVDGEPGAAAVALVDARWRQRPVGLVGDDPATAGTPLLAPLYYVGKALAPWAELRRGTVAELVQRPLAVAVMADLGRLPDPDRALLERWVAGGGVLVRFAGPQLARLSDPLLPVRLRQGGRSLGGAMSWTKAMPLAPFDAASPFAGLDIPDDVRVTTQVLAEPEVDLAAKTWARLEDGTPLVTAAKTGQGWLVLVHTTASPAWSNLALSGLFPAMLRRLLDLSEGVAASPADRALAPVDVLDGFGRLAAPGPAATAITGDPAQIVPGPTHPPGLYGDPSARRAVNLGAALGQPRLMKAPAAATVFRLGAEHREVDLQPWLLAAATALALVDFAVALALRGLLARRGAAAALALALMAAAVPALADDSFAMKAGLETRLAYVRTGDAKADDTSRAGLSALSRLVNQRSTAVLEAPMAVDVEQDPVLFFPLLYWPVTGHQPPPSATAQAKLNDYMRHGGMIVFDTVDQGQDTARLAEATAGLALPALVPLTTEHVLSRSFYLLRETPGRTVGAPVWVEQNSDTAATNDGVSPVVVGANDWASAWAADERGRPLFAVMPGGEQQRELAYRFGVNLVMYALTGNYKSDQVHLPTILERLKR